MDSPCNNVVILIFLHILPGELMSVPEDEVMDVKFSASPEHIGFSTKLFSPAHSNHLYLNCIDVVVFKVGEVDNHFLKAVVGSSVEYDGFIG